MFEGVSRGNVPREDVQREYPMGTSRGMSERNLQDNVPNVPRGDVQRECPRGTSRIMFLMFRGGTSRGNVREEPLG